MSEPRHALFPVCVTLPDESVRHPVKITTDVAGVTHAWAWDLETNEPTEIGTWPATSLERADGRTIGRPLVLTTPDGWHLEGRRNEGCNQGCGCNHPLKAWRPAAHQLAGA